MSQCSVDYGIRLHQDPGMTKPLQKNKVSKIFPIQEARRILKTAGKKVSLSIQLQEESSAEVSCMIGSVIAAKEMINWY